MPALKYFNTDTQTWQLLAVGEQGPAGAAGAAGPQGPAGLNGNVVSGIGAAFTALSGTITPGFKSFVQVPYACVINSATLLSMDGTSGSIVVDIWKDTYANFPPTVADTITAAAKPTIVAGVKSTDATLTGWTTTISEGDVLGFNVDSVSGFNSVLLTLKVTKT